MLAAMDTATRTASLALYDGRCLCYEASWDAGRQHTVHLSARLVGALADLGASAEQLSGVAVTTGPGSFTGLRVALAVAKGLTLTRGIPLVGIPTLDIVAAAQGRDQRPLLAVLQAGRGRICVATYRWRRGWQLREEPHLATWEELAASLEQRVLICGEVDEKGRQVLQPLGERVEVLSPARCLRRAGFLAEMAWARLQAGKVDDPATLVPVYLHQSI